MNAASADLEIGANPLLQRVIGFNGRFGDHHMTRLQIVVSFTLTLP
jgi:hypothetical protein